MPRQRTYCAAVLAQHAITHQALEMLSHLGAAGWDVRLTVRVSDVCLARNLALSEALGSRPDVVLSLDDDVSMTAEDANRLARLAAELCEPVSAIYMLEPTRPAFGRWREDDPHARRFWSGLGALAIPYGLLSDLADRSELCEVFGRPFFAFTWSQARKLSDDRPAYWYADDLTFCHRLDGVRIAPIYVAHTRTAHLAVPVDAHLVPDLPLIEIASQVPKTAG